MSGSDERGKKLIYFIDKRCRGTRMTIYIKGKLNKPDGQTNIDKLRILNRISLQNYWF